MVRPVLFPLTPGDITGLAVVSHHLLCLFIYRAVPLPIYGSIWMIVIGLMIRSLPLATRPMTAAFIQIHRLLEEAGAASGAGMWSSFWRVVLPLLWPSFIRGFLCAFVRSMREDTTLRCFVAKQTLLMEEGR